MAVARETNSVLNKNNAIKNALRQSTFVQLLQFFVPNIIRRNLRSFHFLCYNEIGRLFKTRRLIEVMYFTKTDTKYTHNNGTVNCWQMIS